MSDVVYKCIYQKYEMLVCKTLDSNAEIYTYNVTEYNVRRFDYL